MRTENFGLKIGIEIHQQLEMHKLFCKCPSLVNDPNPADVFFERKLHISSGEMGTMDAAAMYEIKKGKTFYYEGCSGSSCLIEADDEPPHNANIDALKTALEIALLVNAKPVDVVQFMRKIVLDGSNTSGFQRTALIASNGFIETSKGRVGILSICLEEEAAKKINENEKSVNYRLDRLGVPLIEIATDASIKDPEHAKETASILGMILRSSGKVKRGLGTIRQDINLSIKGNPRVEIKGFQDMRSIPKIIEYEISRQEELLKKGEMLKAEVRKAEPNLTTSFQRPMPSASRMYPETDIVTIPITNELLKEIKLPELLTNKAIKLEKEFAISPQLALEIAEDETYFRLLVERFKNILPSLIAISIVEVPKEIKTRFSYNASNKEIEELLGFLDKERATKEAMMKILEDRAKGKFVNIEDYKPADENIIVKSIEKIIKDNKNLSANAIMGIVMAKYRGKIEGKKVMEMIKSSLNS